MMDSTTCSQALTVLESVVKQTGIYAPSRKGRLSVFWGDQVFLPSVGSTLIQAAPTHHIDILCALTGDSFPTQDEWIKNGLEKYGCIACVENADGRLEAAQVEKVSQETAVAMLSPLGALKQVGPSLGSFSVSAEFLNALTTEFDKELTDKTSKLDTDPHFWMPLTLPEESYVSLMKQKGTDESESKAHYDRMSRMKASFDLGSLGLFGAVDVGSDACWWDYGQLALYSKNTLLLLEEASQSSDLLKKFLNVTEHQVSSDLVNVQVDDKSYLFASKVKSGSIVNSLIANVAVGELNANGAIVVNCAAKKITAGEGAILYNLIDESDEGITAAAGEIKVAVTEESGKSMTLTSRMDIDGGEAWKQKLDANELSFEDVHKKNKNANICEIAKKREEKFASVAASLGF
jgi:hypothetical protein